MVDTRKVHVILNDISCLRLVQSEGTTLPMSLMYYGDKRPKDMINCSYFTSKYALGRNQGDIVQDTGSYSEQKYLSFAVNPDGSYKAGKLEFWDIPQSVCGFTPACINVLDGKRASMCSEGLGFTYEYKMNLATAVTMFGVLSDKKTAVFVTAEKGIKGSELVDYMLGMYEFDFLCTLDGGGSTEMIRNGVIAQASTDGIERKMHNALAFVDILEEQVKEEDKNFELMYPCAEGWASQANHDGGACDIGWLSSYSSNGQTNIIAAADGIVEFAGEYKQVLSGKTYLPKGVIIRHKNLMETKDIVSIYWHLSSVYVKEGQKVAKGDILGLKGTTGYSTGVHLHFQTLMIPKGADIPQNHDGNGWAKYSFYPVPFMYVYPYQIFDEGHVDRTTGKKNGQFTLKKKNNVEKVETPVEDLDLYLSQIEALNSDIALLKEENEELKRVSQNNISLRIEAENAVKIYRSILDDISEVMKRNG